MRFFGLKEIAVLGHSVQMATAERAVLDAIDRPRYAGGIGEASWIVGRAGSKVSWNELVALARKRGSSGKLVRPWRGENVPRDVLSRRRRNRVGAWSSERGSRSRVCRSLRSQQWSARQARR